MAETLSSRSSLEQLALPFAAGLAMLGFSLVNFLNHHSYPLLRMELAYLYAGLVVLCAAMAALYRGQRLWGRVFLEALLVGAFIDLNLQSLWLTATAFLVSFAFVLATRRSLLPFTTAIGSVMLVTSIAGVGRTPHWFETKIVSAPQHWTAGNAEPPTILHLILDEHGGFEGFPNRHPAADRMKADLREFYASRGFAMFARAYSEHHETVNSIPYMFNFGSTGALPADPQDFSSVQPNKYFSDLDKRGYQLRIYQSEFADFCGAVASASCTTYHSNSAGALVGLPLDSFDKMQLILFKFLALSDALQAINMETPQLLHALVTQYPVNPPLGRLGYTNPIASLQMMDRLAEDLRRASPGEIYFAHLLVPHFPWVVDADCEVRALEQWDREILIAPVTARERAYFEQLRCVTKKTDLLLQSLANSPAGANAVVLVHGDHGSRISARVPNLANYGKNSSEDLIAGFGTLFAVRSPHIRPKFVEAPSSLADLLRQLSESDFTKLPIPSQRRPTVYISDGEWRPQKRIALPETW